MCAAASWLSGLHDCPVALSPQGLGVLFCICRSLSLLPTFPSVPCQMPKDLFLISIHAIFLGKEYLFLMHDQLLCRFYSLRQPNPLWIRWGNGTEPGRALLTPTASHCHSGGSASLKLHHVCPRRPAHALTSVGLGHPQAASSMVIGLPDWCKTQWTFCLIQEVSFELRKYIASPNAREREPPKVSGPSATSLFSSSPLQQRKQPLISSSFLGRLHHPGTGTFLLS